MTEAIKALFEFEAVRKAIVFNFGWAIHVSPEANLASIREKGLIANRDAPIPPDLTGFVAKSHVLCMHPLGAKCCPPPVCNTIENTGDLKMVTFAVKTENIPQRVHIDWSFSWEIQRGRIRSDLTGEQNATRLITDFGSFVAYEAISPANLRVFCEGCPPANPKRWPMLPDATGIATYLRES